MNKLIRNMLGLLAPYIPKEQRKDPQYHCRNYYEWYYTYGKVFQPRSLLEIGVFHGASAISIAIGTEVLKKILLIDSGIGGINPETICSKIERIHPHALINSYKKNTLTLKTIPPRYGLFDMTHIDGNHSYAGVTKDLKLVSQITNRIIIIDDIGQQGCCDPSESIRQAVFDFLRENRSFTLLMEINNFTGHFILIRHNFCQASGLKRKE